MKTGFLKRLAAQTAVFAIFILLAPTSAAQEKAAERERTISVSGNGEIAAAPDQAVLRLGAIAQASQADLAQIKVNETMQKILEAVEKLGIPPRSIRTTGISLMPVYASERVSDVSNDGTRISGFRANDTIEITLENPKSVGKVIDAAIGAGANQLHGVSFSLKNDLPQRSSALTLAAKEARSKAETIAKALDLQLGSILEVVEEGVRIMPHHEGFAGGRMMAANMAQTPIEPGEVRVHAGVTVRFQIRPASGAR